MQASCSSGSGIRELLNNPYQQLEGIALIVNFSGMSFFSEVSPSRKKMELSSMNQMSRGACWED